MKKIFAFILASIMVLSLVPASAFAAVTNCPKTHTVAVCDSLGISYSQIGNPVAPSCTSAGYTLYACDECGEEFVGNFTEKAGHNYQPDPKRLTENVKADCTTKTNGLTYVVCSVCGDKNVDKNGVQQPIEVSWNHKSVHKLVAVAGSGVGCEARSRCSLCGAEGYLNEETGELDSVAAHKWEFVEVIEEPVWANGEATPGLAKYKCTVCGDTKKIDIIAPLCICSEKEIVLEATEATCESNGSYAVYKCPDCAKYWTLDENEALVELDDKNADGVVNELDGIIVKEHEADPEFEAVRDGCDVTYVCKNCEGTFTVKDHTGETLSDIKGFASCVSVAYYVYVCTACTETWVEPVGSTSLNHETSAFVVAQTCNSLGYRGTYCKTETPYTDEEIKSLTLGKDYYTVIEYPNGESGGAVAKHYKVVAYTTIAADNTSHRVGQWVDGEFIDKADWVAPKKCLGQKDTVEIWTCYYLCQSYGYVPEVVKAKGHNERVLGTINNPNTGSAFATTFDYYTMGTDGKLTSTKLSVTKDKKVTIKVCVDCGAMSKSEAAKVGTTTIEDSIEAAKEKHGYLVRYIYDGAGMNAKVTGYSYEEVGKKITLQDNLIAINCSSVGYVKFTSGIVSGTFYAKQASENHVINTEIGWVQGTVPKCDKAGSYGYYVCALCSAKFRYKGNDYDLLGAKYYGMMDEEAGQEVISSLVINKHTDTLVEVDTACGGTSYFVCTAEDCGAIFADAKATKAYSVSADPHTWVYAKGYEGDAATCNADGTLQIRWCSECKVLQFNALYESADEIISVNMHTVDSHTAKNTYTLEVDENGIALRKFEIAANGQTATDLTATKCSAIIEKFNHYAPVLGFGHYIFDEISGEYVKLKFLVGDNMILPCDSQNANDDHTEAQYDRYMCVVCDYEYLTNYIPATGGHINANGEILTTECDNGAITERECVVCKKTIAIDHVQSEVLEVEANCSTVGYVYWYCLTPGCGHRSVTGELAIDPDVHDLVDYGFEANYAHDGQEYSKCALCGEIVDEPNALPAPTVAGVEITLSTEFDSYMPGSIVNVTVSLDSLLGVDIWAARFPVIYDPAVYEYVGILEGSVAAEFSSAYAILTANNISKTEVELISGSNDMYCATGNVGAAGVLSVVAQAEEDIYVKGSYNLVTFQFKVIATSVADDTDTSFTVAATEVKNPSKFGAVHYYEDVVLAWNTVDCPIQVVNEKAKTVKNMYGDGENSVAPVLHTFLDLDGDTFLTLADAKALYALIIDTDAEYTVLADADADGFITIADLNALYQIFTGAKTIDEILNPEEEKVLGPREMRYENGALVYDSYCDFDFSGKIDQTSEMACMSGREDYKLFWAELGYTIP